MVCKSKTETPDSLFHSGILYKSVPRMFWENGTGVDSAVEDCSRVFSKAEPQYVQSSNAEKTVTRLFVRGLPVGDGHDC